MKEAISSYIEWRVMDLGVLCLLLKMACLLPRAVISLAGTALRCLMFWGFCFPVWIMGLHMTKTCSSPIKGHRNHSWLACCSLVGFSLCLFLNVMAGGYLSGGSAK